MPIVTRTTLYKRTVTGKIQIWRMEIDGDRYRVVSGQQDGAKVESAWTIATPKNVGRANETTPTQQAILEVESEYRDKLSTGYVEDVANVDTVDIVKPMLAKDFDHYVAKIDFRKPVWSQPKLDGFRCLALANGLFSRTWERFASVPHIEKVLKPLFEKVPNLVLDGELYNHELKDDFNTLSSILRKTKLTGEDLDRSAGLVQYHVYDSVLQNPYGQRYASLQQIVSEIDNPLIRLVPARLATSMQDLDEDEQRYVADGYEGQMVRHTGAVYEHKRSSTLLKRKRFQDAEFPILGVDEGLGNKSGMAGAIRTQTETGKPFSAGMRGDRAFLRKILENAQKLVGKQVTIRYFQLTPDGIPRFPVVTKVHEKAKA